MAEFDREETEIILKNLPPEELPVPVLAKLKELDLEEYSPVLGRNLLALRDAARIGRPGLTVCVSAGAPISGRILLTYSCALVYISNHANTG